MDPQEMKNQAEDSFRDPCGFVFRSGKDIFRQINHQGKEDYELLMGSGLYEDLASSGFLIPHVEVESPPARASEAFKVIRPERIEFISYPQEWCFGQIKDAALLTLRIQKKALSYGMNLKDANGFNIQFREGKPVFIDTLSFERYTQGAPWVAYKQFCEHFLSPLLLIKYKGLSSAECLGFSLNGVSLGRTRRLIPWSSYLSLPLLIHVHLHNQGQRHLFSVQKDYSQRRISRFSLTGLIDHLESLVFSLNIRGRGEWGDYYSEHNYSSDAFDAKAKMVAEFIDRIGPQTVGDVGANIGIFSRIVSRKGIKVVSFDKDPYAVEKNYQENLSEEGKSILPLVADISNPTPGMGWKNQERRGLLDRFHFDTVLCLALLHHLAIGNNLPFGKIAELFSLLGGSLVIEFVPKDDSQVQKMLSVREDIFSQYSKENFEKEFGRYFHIIHQQEIAGSKRVLYLMTKR